MIPTSMLIVVNIGVLALLADGALLGWGAPWVFGLGLPLRRGSEELLVPLTEALPSEVRGTQAAWIGDAKVGY